MQTLDPGTTGRSPLPRGPKKLLPARAVWERYGVTDRTIDRWVADPNLGFPQPLRINRKRFFYEHELDQFDLTRR